MKGFLSLLGITLIVGAFGLILLSFYGNPLEEMNSQERMYAYMETRENHSTENDTIQDIGELETNSVAEAAPLKAMVASDESNYMNLAESCGQATP